jgi:hypothetical protein
MPDVDLMDRGFERVRFRLGNTPLFTPDSPTDRLYSSQLSIGPNKNYMFRAHGVPEGRRIFLEMVSKAFLEKDSPMDLFYQTMTLGGAEQWVMSRERSQMLVTLPGVYRFRLENEDMLGGDMQLEYYFWDGPPAVFPVY